MYVWKANISEELKSMIPFWLFYCGQVERLAAVCNGARVTMADNAAPEAEAAEAPKGFTPLTLKADTSAPIFGGSTGGLLRKAQVEEFYVITLESPKEQIFQMPTGTIQNYFLNYSFTLLSV